VEITCTVKIQSCNSHLCKCTTQNAENLVRMVSMNKDLKYSEVSVATRKLLSAAHTSGERIKVDGQEAFLLM
jgi:hypothetical protein